MWAWSQAGLQAVTKEWQAKPMAPKKLTAAALTCVPTQCSTLLLVLATA